VDGKWLSYRFDSGSKAHPLEGMLGDGDSGGPVLIQANGSWKLAGLAAWKAWQGDLANFRAGIYGQVSYQVRVSHYAEWIDGVIAAAKDE
jgi:secreted trypsin-like serine protease